MAQPRTRAKPGLHTAAIACIAPWLSLASAAAASEPPAEPSPDSTATSQPAPADITLNLGEVFVGLSSTSTSATGRQSVLAAWMLSTAATPLLSSLPAESPAAEGVSGSRGQYELTDGFSIAGSASDVTLAGAAGSARRTTMQMMEVSAQLDAIKLEDLTLSLVTGVYYAAEGRPDARPDNEELTPVIGPSLRLRNTQGLGTLRLMALADASGANEDFMELRIDQVWRLTSQANLSLGYQYQRSIFSDTPALAGRAGNAREAVTLELSLKF